MNVKGKAVDARHNLASRAAGWSAAHWKRATFGWLAFVAAAVLLGTAAGATALKQEDTASGEAATAEHILAHAHFQRPATESVLVQSPTLTSRDRGFSAVVGEVIKTVSAFKDVTNVQNPLRSVTQVSRDGHSALVQFDIKGDQDKAKGKVQPIIDAVANVQKAYPAFRVEEFGLASANHVIQDTLNQDFQRAEVLSIPITLIILVLAFGSLVAAGIPVLLAFTAVLGAIGLNELLSHVLPTSDVTRSVILLVGMAVGVDYSLFYLRREREERTRGLGPHRALLRAAGTSGQAVLISGVTVLIAMAGMLFAGNSIFTSIGLGTMIVVFVAVVGSLSVLPAILHKLGDRVEKGRIPFVRRGSGESRFWAAVLRPVLRHPWVSMLVSAGALLALAVPVLSMHTKLPSFTDLPKSLPIVGTYKQVQKAFPGSQTPAEVVVRGENVTSKPYRVAYDQFRKLALTTGELFRPFHVFVSPDKTVARVEFSIAGNGDNDASMHALNTLRTAVIPQIAPNLPEGSQVAVTGETAGTHDFNELMKQRAPFVFAFVLGLAFVLLLLTFRSIVIPIKAIVLNLLSVGAAYGILIMVFQWGHLQGLLGFRSNGAITSWLPLFLFVILFGLSMDYHVFILSRIKELVDRGAPTEQAVERGIKSTAGTVTSAAIVMVAVFGIFGSLRELDIKQMGFGLAVAVLIDATVIRGVLLPSAMKVLGDWNWYLPRWLEWLPSLAIEGSSGEKEVVEAPRAATGT
jgi:RND superfamily putative drug exporter